MNVTNMTRPIGNLYMHQAHGLIMLTAWMIFMSLAIMFARYFRPAWPDKKVLGKPVWFQCHTYFNVIGLILTGISIVLIFSAVRGISGFKSFRPLFTKAHPYMGMVVTGLLFLNAFMSICRGDPKDAWRPVFNWVHWAVGMACYILAIVTVFSGLNMSSFCPTWTIWVMLAWTILHIAICIVLEIQKCKGSDLVAKAKNVYNPVPELSKKKGDEDPNEKDSLLYAGYEVKEDAGNKLRYSLLAVWILITLPFFGVLFWGTLTGSWTGI